MGHLAEFRKGRRGMETITAVFMLLLIITGMITVVAASFSYNDSVQKQLKTERERALEQIAIVDVGMGMEQRLTSITVRNAGTIEVKIRAFYREQDGIASFIGDPSTMVAPSSNKTIDVTSLALTVNPKALLIAATERGVKSKGVNEMSLVYGEPPTGVDTSGLTVGPLLLTFDSMSWASCKNNGDLTSSWQQRWTIPVGTCAWQLNLTNVDTENRSLTINQYSGFTMSKVSSPSTTTWFLKVPQYTVAWNQTIPVTFVWDTILSMSAQKANTNQKGVNNVFLTVFGNYSDGKTFAQTIPFEALTVV